MITVKDFQIKNVQDLVEKELNKLLEKSFPPKHSFTLRKTMFSVDCRNDIIKELERRGFTDITTYEDSIWIIFYFGIGK